MTSFELLITQILLGKWGFYINDTYDPLVK